MLEDHLDGELLAPVSALCCEGRIEPDVLDGCLHQIIPREWRG